MSKEFDELKKVIKNEDEDVDIQLDAAELENPVEDDNEEEHEESHMEKFSAMVRQSLSEEHEAAAQYTKRAAKCEKHGMEDAAKLFRDIAAEEVVHAGEFQALMEKYGILDQESIEQGEQEGKEILDGEKEEPEIDAPEVPADDVENESMNEYAGDEDYEDDEDYKPTKKDLRNQFINMFDIWSTDKKVLKLADYLIEYFSIEQVVGFVDFLEDKGLDPYMRAESANNTENCEGDNMKDEAQGRENPAVHIIKKGTGNMNYSAKSMKDAIAYVKQQNLDLENGDYFDIHTGMNTSEPKELDFWGGTGAGYWRNVLNNPKTKERDKQIISGKEVKSLNQLHESRNESVSETIYHYLVQYADNEGLNIADLTDYDPAEIAEWISDRAGIEVNPDDVEELIQEESEDCGEYEEDEEDYTNEDYLNASPDPDYALKSLLPGEQHIPVKYYTERNIRNIYCSYLVQDMPDTSTMKDVDKINATYDEIRSKADNDPIDEIIDFLNKTGDLEVHKRTENEDAQAGTVASTGEAPTVVAGKDVVEAKPTKMCEELKALKEALEN